MFLSVCFFDKQKVTFDCLPTKRKTITIAYFLACFVECCSLFYLVMAEESMTKQYCPVTQNILWTTALSFVNCMNKDFKDLLKFNLKLISFSRKVYLSPLFFYRILNWNSKYQKNSFILLYLIHLFHVKNFIFNTFS